MRARNSSRGAGAFRQLARRKRLPAARAAQAPSGRDDPDLLWGGRRPPTPEPEPHPLIEQQIVAAKPGTVHPRGHVLP